MSYLSDLRDMGIHVNWRTLLIGLEGPGKHPPLLSLEEVRAFADEQLTNSAVPPEGAVAVTIALDGDPDEIHTILRKLAHEEKSEPARELRKWRLALLKRAMMELPQDPLYGLLALTEFWERFDFSPDSPHAVQGRGNQTSPTDYFTEDNYRRLIQKHREWISAETTALRG